MTLRSSQQMAFLRQSEIRNMTLECSKLSGINLSQGVCDTELPEPVRLGAAAAMLEGTNSYTRYDGLTTLREAIAQKILRDTGASVDPETEIVVTSGATGAFYAACLGLFDGAGVAPAVRCSRRAGQRLFRRRARRRPTTIQLCQAGGRTRRSLPPARCTLPLARRTP